MGRRIGGRALVLLIGAFCIGAGAGCWQNTEFSCNGTSECVARGVAGVCEPDQHCSFPSTNCASGRRYGDFSGPFSGQCVGEEQQDVPLPPPVIPRPSEPEESTGLSPDDLTTGPDDPSSGGDGPDAEASTGQRDLDDPCLSDPAACPQTCDAVEPADGAGDCPDSCDACNGSVCQVLCDEPGECMGAPIVCPGGWDCEVVCSERQACKGATVDGPTDGSLRVDCVGEETCDSIAIECGTRRCEVDCGPGPDVCEHAQIECGAGPCAADCAGGESPTVACNDACSCSWCG